jgi:uncharacterized protein (TIGR02145 family)
MFAFVRGSLTWSYVADNTMTHYKAEDYCEDIGGRLPTVSEFRTLIQNCSLTQTGGSCTLIDSCLTESCLNDSCSGCSGSTSGQYSVFGDYVNFWTSSVDGNGLYAWLVLFRYGRFMKSLKNYKQNVRCVK